jgi:hypothetical protein
MPAGKAAELTIHPISAAVQRKGLFWGFGQEFGK